MAWTARIVTASLSISLAACSANEKETVADDSAPTNFSEAESKVSTNPLKNAYFGELHLHTAYSLDAYIFGTKLNTPFEAYKFAKGQTIDMPAGGTKTIIAPLDFTAITDHGEALGEYELCTSEQSPKYDSEICKGIRAGDQKPFGEIFAGVSKVPAQRYTPICDEDGKICRDYAGKPWQNIQKAADQNYEPGKFTSFVAYEFSANAPEGKGGMMHRNVIFRSNRVPQTIFSAFEGTGEQLHVWLDKNCTGDCKVLAIPHNPNFYWGRLFWGKNSDGTEWTKDQVERRARLEPLVEIMQVKGNSECQTGIGTTDESCNFETVFKKCAPGENAGCSNENAFVRNGLKKGLLEYDKWGVNPFKYGFVGGTDNHNGTPSDTTESDFKGHYAKNDFDPAVRLGLKANPTAEQMGLSGAEDPTRFYNPGAITGVWAEANTRPAIWDALARRETFATSGTRTKVRMFGGFAIPAGADKQADWVKIGYKDGVPQGGTLTRPGKDAPRFILYAQRDPNSAPLHRLQIIKGWADASGKTHEMTYDVACSDGMAPGADGKCPDNGAGVDLATCKQTGGKGSAMLSATWQDPKFDPKQKAFYYLRVLENPVCRWSMYDSINNKLPYPKDLPKTIRERAWSSPIWYMPET